jgi:hypothetical protein
VSIGSTLKCVLAFVVMVALPLASVGTARGQDDLASIPDSLLNFRYKITPIFEMKTTGNVTYNQLSGNFNNTIVGVNGLSVSTMLSIGDKVYRLQDRNEQQKQFTNSLSKLVRRGFVVTMTHSDMRRLNRAALVTGGFQDFILNNQSLNANATYTSARNKSYGWDGRVMTTIQNNEFAFKEDQGQGARVNGGVRYRLMGNRIRVKMRGAYNEMTEKSSSVLESFDGLSTHDDSLLTTVDIKVADSLNVGVDWTDYSYERVFADQARGSTGAQQVGAENLFRETERKELRRYGVNMNTTPMPGLTLKMGATHSEQVSDYVNTPTRYSRVVTDELSGDLDYNMRSGTTVVLRLENTDALRDLGEQSVSSYSDQRQRVSLAVRKSFSPTFSVNVTAAQGIAQSFYLDFKENPRDRDQIDTSIKANMTSRPFPKIATRMFFTVSNTEFVNIHQSQSENNRPPQRYDFSPMIT